MQHRRDRTRAILQLLPILLGVLIVIVVALWNEGQERRALTAMPASERQPLYERTWESFKALCSNPNAAFSSECRERADFLRKFPECREECQSLARGGATR